MLHGELVAFGTLVQLVVEGRDDAEVAELLELLCAVNLPVTFAQLGQAASLSAEEMSTIVSATLTAAYSKNMHPPLTAGRLEDALVTADATGASALQKRK
jgi:glycerol dehydrogenase